MDLARQPFSTSDSLAVIGDALSVLTNHARVDVNQIIYNREEKREEIPVYRKKVEFKQTMFGRRPRYQEEVKETILRIGSVENFLIRTDPLLLAELKGIFTVLLGLRMDGSTICLCSAEERQGKTMCEIVVQVSDIHIEVVDID